MSRETSSPRERSAPQLEGRRLGRYEILARLAQGGMATVYVGRMQGAAGFERLVAIKVPHAHLANEEEFVNMFLDEARLAARIRHPNVVATIDVHDDEEDGWFLVMEYVEGDHLGTLLSAAAKRGERLPVPVAVRIVLDVLAGLDAAHVLVDERGKPLSIVHRDVSPQNVLVSTDGVARLTDFGVAKAEWRLQQTRDQQLKGKLGYIAPEQASNGHADVRSDLFAMGIVLWESLCGRRLFRGENDAATLTKVLAERIAPPSEIDSTLAPFDDVVMATLSRDPDARPQSASELIERLEAAAHEWGAASGAAIAQTRTVAEHVKRLAGDKIARTRKAIQAARDGVIGSGDIEDLESGSLSRTSASRRMRATDAETVARPRTGSGRMTPTPEPAVVQPEKPRWWRWALAGGAALILGTVAVGIAWTAGTQAGSGSQGSATPSVAPTTDSAPVLAEGAPPRSPDPSSPLSPTIVVRVEVGADGQVVSAHIARPRADLARFEAAAVASVRGYRFEPAVRNGVRVAEWVNLPVGFASQTAPTRYVRIKGSDTIGGALAPDLGRAFSERHPDVRVDVEALGSSTAFAGLFDASADIGASSRPIRATELAEANRLGLSLREVVIGYDGIAIVVHRDNPVRSLTLTELARLYAGEVHDFAEVHGSPGPVHLVGRPDYSGTHDFFRDEVLHHGDPSRVFSEEVEVVEHSEEVVRFVAADPRAIAYVGVGFVTPNVRVVGVVPAQGGEPVLPSPETISAGTYPIFRPLLFYTRGAPTDAVADFLRFVLSPEGRRLVERHGFVPSEATAESVVAGPSNVAEGARREPVRLLFRAGTALPDGAAGTLERALRELEISSRHALIVGHADSREDDAQATSRGRAESVAAYLREHGVDASRLQIEPAGASQPLGSNESESGRRLNRRVEVFVLD